MIHETSIVYYNENQGSININSQHDTSDIIYSVNLAFVIKDGHLQFKLTNDIVHELSQLFGEIKLSNVVLGKETVGDLLSLFATPLIKHLNLKDGN